MVSVEKLHSYLNKNSTELSTEERSYVFRIPESKLSEDHIYGKYVMDAKFGFLSKDLLPIPAWTELDGNYQLLIDKSANINTFASSLLNQIMPEFRYFNGKSRLQFMKDLYRQIAYDMEEKSLYRDMDYTRQRVHIRKDFMDFVDIDGDEFLRKVLVDYFSLTVYVLRKDPVEKFGRTRLVEKIAFVPGVWKKTERVEEYSIKNPTCILVENEGKYVGIVRRDLRGVMSWQEDGMESLFRILSEESEKEVKPKKSRSEKPKEISLKIDVPMSDLTIDTAEESEEDMEIHKVSVAGSAPTQAEEVREMPVISKKITLLEIQELAENEGISLTKKSDKTGKDLKKTIQELRDEIMKKYE